MPYFFISLSKDGKNQGCINVKADCPAVARCEMEKLGIAPDYDHAQAYMIDEPELPLNTLVSPEEMKTLGYVSSREMGE